MRDFHEAGPAGEERSMRRRIAAACVFAVAFCWPLAAATVSKLNDDVLAPLRGPVLAKQIHISNMPLYAHGNAKIELEEFQVWAPEGKVIVHNGKSVQYLDPPPMRFFRGMVNGDPESFAYFSVDGTTGAIYGLLATRDGKFAIGASRRNPLPHNRVGGARTDPRNDFDYFLEASDESDEIPMTGQTWACDVEKLPVLPHINRRLLAQTNSSGLPIIAQGITGTQSYAMAMEVETDDEFYANAGSNVTTATNYITNLTGAVSTIYNRDLHTNVVQQHVNIYSGGPSTDPWSATTNPFTAMIELGDYYHAHHLALKRSAVVMLSGKDVASGIAWEGTIGAGDADAGGGDYFGGYSWCGGIGHLFGFTGLGTVPDPNATSNGTLYGMPGTGSPSGPTGIQGYWPLEEYAHELGHNLAGHHTHCVAISALEASGTNHPTQLFVDMCYTGNVPTGQPGTGEVDDDHNGHTSTCAAGLNYSSAPTEKGTIMSYCHNVFVSSVPQSRFTFGQASEVSHHELDDYMLRAAGPIGPYGGDFNIVNAVGTMTMTTITASSSVAANSTGNTASVNVTNGGTPTYSWTITGGTITSATNIASIIYTAGASGSVVLRATAYKNGTDGFTGFPNGGVGITDTKTVTIVTCAGASISTQPSSTSIVTGQTATLTVAASGTATLSYQWYTGTASNTASPVGGGTGASVNVSPATTTSYWVRVTNSCGTADSVTVTVTVTTNPPSVATLFYPVTPCRIIDTRNANGPQGGPALVSGGTRNITVAGVCGIPTGVVAISINVAVVSPSAGGYLTLYTGPANASLPLASTINYQTNRTLANNGIVRAGSDTMNVFNGGPTVHFVIDVNGYFK
jgi:hypothetical protein